MVVNVLLVGAYLWSRPGGETTVRVEASGNSFRAFVDGRMHGPVRYDALPSGGVGFRLAPSDGIPSRRRSTIRSIRVTDSATGAVLLEDSFDGQSPAWRLSGSWHRGDGAFWTPTGGDALTGDRPWQDYVFEARFRNLADAVLFVRVRANGDGIGFALRPFREFDSVFFVQSGGQAKRTQALSMVETDRLETTRSILATTLRWYPSLGLVALAALVALGTAFLPGVGSRLVTRTGDSVAYFSHALAVSLALATFGTLLAIMWAYGDRAPHVPDEVAYLFQAKIFASFDLSARVPPMGDHFAFVIQDGGRWFAGYPFGHPLVLAVGELARAPWLVPPVVGALTTLGVYLLGRHVYGPLVGLAAALLLFASPFFQMTASNFMSHNTGSLALVAAAFFLLREGDRPWLTGLASGLALGFLLNIRPLTAAGLLVPFTVWLVLDWRAAHDRRAAVYRSGWWVAGFACMVVAFLLYNNALTGSLLKTPYSYGTLTRDNVGFFGDHSFAAGLMNTETNFALLVLVLHGWPVFVGLLLVLLPFVLGTTRRADYFLLACVLSIVAAWMAYRGVWIMHGPRFWYEAVPFLVLLAARGAQRFVEVVDATGERLGRVRQRGAALDVRGVAALVAGIVLMSLIGYGLHGWTLARHEAFPPILYVPRTMQELRGFNNADARLVHLADEKEIRDAVVFVRPCAHWQCYGTVFWKNSPNLDGEIVWARDLGRRRNAALMSSFPGRTAYLADYAERTIVTLELPRRR